MSVVNAVGEEERGNYIRAISLYKRLLRENDPLGRIGVYQAIARCFERLARRYEAASFREKAAASYLKLSAKSLPRPEACYYALLEYRGALQNIVANKKRSWRLLIRHTKVLDEYLRLAGYEGVTHEVLFAASACKRLSLPLKAAGYFVSLAKFSQKSLDKKHDKSLVRLVRECYLEASKSFRQKGLQRKALLAERRAAAIC